MQQSLVTVKSWQTHRKVFSRGKNDNNQFEIGTVLEHDDSFPVTRLYFSIW